MSIFAKEDDFLRAIAENPGKSIEQIARERVLMARKRCGVLPTSQQAAAFVEAQRKSESERRAREEERERQAAAAEKAQLMIEDLARKKGVREFADQWINTSRIDQPLVTFTMGFPYSQPEETLATNRETFLSLCKAVCEKYGVTKLDIQSYRRDRAIIQPRQELYWLCRHRTFMSWNIIGRMLHKDHTSVLHGCKAYEQYRREKPLVLSGRIKGKNGIDYRKIIGGDE